MATSDAAYKDKSMLIWVHVGTGKNPDLFAYTMIREEVVECETHQISSQVVGDSIGESENSGIVHISQQPCWERARSYIVR